MTTTFGICDTCVHQGVPHATIERHLYNGYCSICCPDCKTIWSYYGLLPHTPTNFERLYDHLRKQHGVRWECDEKKTHTGNGTYKGAWAFTITASPADNRSADDMIKAVKKVLSQKSIPVIKFAWYLEYKEGKTHPHIHGMYETAKGGRIESKHFKRAWDLWDESVHLGLGHRGGYHRPVRSDENYASYISKDNGANDNYGI